MTVPHSLLKTVSYSNEWIKDFYTQASIWWGAEPHDSADEHIKRLAMIKRLCGERKLRILDLGCGSGSTAATFADAGHDVVGVELNPTDIGYAQKFLEDPHKGLLNILQGDFYTIQLEGCFDVVTWWEGFGLGSDGDQRCMLRRIVQEWLAPNGCALIDVYNPARPARYAGETFDWDALENVPGSVQMVQHCHYDVINNVWIDEWEPVETTEKALAQAIRCYSPADLILLLEGTGLAIERLEIDGQEIDFKAQKIHLLKEWLDLWAYLVKLVPSEKLT